MTHEEPRVGIEAIHAYVGRACIDVRELFAARGLDQSRFERLRMHEKSVALPCEDVVTNAVNAARPLLHRMSAAERQRIELLIVATESAVDFGKAASTWAHEALSLSRRCRLLEVKQACYGATCALQLAAGFIASRPRADAKALVIASDLARAMGRGQYHEPSQGTMGVAMLVSTDPRVLELDHGASGCTAYDVDDACRPTPDTEEGDAELTLFSYLDCLIESFRAYQDVVADVDPLRTFDHLAFHMPFGGMVVAAHRKLMATFSSLGREQITEDFERRVAASLGHGMRVGNGYSASLYLALCALLDSLGGAALEGPRRVGLFSYGSGCSSEFFSGVLSPDAPAEVARARITQSIEERQRLTIAEYDRVLDLNEGQRFGAREQVVNVEAFADLWRARFEGQGLYVLDRVEGHHRKYRFS